jgi:hypothetical protein
MDGRLPHLPAPRARRLAAGLLGLLAVVAALLAPAAARADAGPAARWPVGGSTLSTAMGLAVDHWGFSPCGGRVALRWAPLAPGINAQSSWANDVDPYLQPSRNTDCEIALSTRPEWDWVMLCSVVVHEVGHLTGHDHVDDEHDVMYYAYVEPVRECALTPEPAETGAPAPAPSAPATAAAPRGAPKAAATKRAKRAKKPKARKGRAVRRARG